MFTDRDVAQDPERVEEALKAADAFFASLVFDYDQVCALSLLSRVGCRLLRKPRGFHRFPAALVSALATARDYSGAVDLCLEPWIMCIRDVRALRRGAWSVRSVAVSLSRVL